MMLKKQFNKTALKKPRGKSLNNLGDYRRAGSLLPK
jgi:hypothetical protein